MKKIAILQSNYIPWKGYFDIINSVDVFVFYDDLQYTKNDWRNRNKIKVNAGLEWLTIPCGSNQKRLICEVTLKEYAWQVKHWDKLKRFYASAAYFKEVEQWLKPVYLGKKWTNLSELNHYLIMHISKNILGSTTEFVDSRDLDITGKKQERLIEIVKKLNGTSYLTGPAAKSYIDEATFSGENIELLWMDYTGYPEYCQLGSPFEHDVTILDLIFNEGPNATQFMKSFK